MKEKERNEENVKRSGFYARWTLFCRSIYAVDSVFCIVCFHFDASHCLEIQINGNYLSAVFSIFFFGFLLNLNKCFASFVYTIRFELTFSYNGDSICISLKWKDTRRFIFQGISSNSVKFRGNEHNRKRCDSFFFLAFVGDGRLYTVWYRKSDRQ